MVAPHPELISTLSCEAALCGSQGLIRALQTARPRQGLLKTSGRAGASPLPAKLWFFRSVVSFLCVAVRCSPPATRPAIPCCSATPSLLRRLFCKPGRGRWDDVTPKTCCFGWPRSKIPTSRCWSVTAKTLVAMSAEEQQHCTFCSSSIWDVLKHLVVIIPNYLINFN